MQSAYSPCKAFKPICLLLCPKAARWALGAGKAGAPWRRRWRRCGLPMHRSAALVVTRYDHIPPRTGRVGQRIEVVEAAHPVPDAAGLQAAERTLALTQGLTADDLVICPSSLAAARPCSRCLPMAPRWPKTAHQQRTVGQRCRHWRDELRAQAPLAHQGGGRLVAACARRAWSPSPSAMCRVTTLHHRQRPQRA